MCCVLIGFAGLAAAQRKTLACPKATAYRRVKIKPERAESALFARYEEFCQGKRKTGDAFKHGPYKLWGPNGEVLVEGQFVDGERDGKWKKSTPRQIGVEFWTKGRLIESEGYDRTDFVTIDFRRCAPQSGLFYQGSGTGNPFIWTYEVLAGEGNFCKIKYSVREDAALSPEFAIWNYCRVSKAKNKLPLDAIAAVANQYCEVGNESQP
jgi:hypothetical protein